MSALWGVTAFFNPVGYASKLENFRRFRAASKRQGLKLVAMELVYDDAPPALCDDDAERVVVRRGGSETLLWQKEALLNIALAHLPNECRYVAWLDADVVFANPWWIEQTCRALQDAPVVQPWSHFYQLPPGDDGSRHGERVADSGGQQGFGLGVARRGPACSDPFGRTGSAWAARRALLDKHGFYDRLVLGDADSFMAYAFTGCDAFLQRNGDDFPRALIDHYRRWSRAVFDDVGGRVGYVDGALMHLWHGEPSDRHYGRRRAVLKRHNYDPDHHVRRCDDGLLAWSGARGALRDSVAAYFRLRREDDGAGPDAGARRVLVTGMSGKVGGILGRGLARRYPLRALNRTAVEGVESVTADLRDAQALAPALDGVDTVVHCAAYTAGNGVRHIDVNIRGSYNLFEAAVRAGVRRVVYISSGAVQQAFESEPPFLSMVQHRLDDIADPPPQLGHHDPLRPVRMYGVAKACVEVFGRMYAETGKLSVLCLRLGRVRPDDRPHNSREAAVYISHRDLVQLVEKAIEAPDDLSFGIYYGVSDNRTRFRDLGPARRDLGYVPLDGIAEWPPAAG